MSRQLTARGRERRQQLLDFAIERFAQNGFHPTSVGEIVEGVGVGKGVFYWYFDSKEELFVEILKTAQLDLRKTQQRAIRDEGDPIRRLEAGLRASIRWFSENSARANLLAFAATDNQFAPHIRRGREVATQDVARHIKDGIVEGVIRDCDPEWLATAILGAVNNIVRVLIRERNEDVDEVTEAAVAFCLDGLR